MRGSTEFYSHNVNGGCNKMTVKLQWNLLIKNTFVERLSFFRGDFL